MCGAACAVLRVQCSVCSSAFAARHVRHCVCGAACHMIMILYVSHWVTACYTLCSALVDGPRRSKYIYIFGGVGLKLPPELLLHRNHYWSLKPMPFESKCNRSVRPSPILARCVAWPGRAAIYLLHPATPCGGDQAVMPTPRGQAPPIP